MKKVIAIVVLMGLVGGLGAGCAGVRTADETYVAHGTAFHFFGIKLPGDSLEMAEKQVPSNAKTKQTILAGPSDWTSVLGVMNNIFGFSHAKIGGEL